MPQLVALMDDLLFLSRIREAARAAAVEVRAVRGAADLVAAARGGARLVLVDADGERLPWAEALAALRSEADCGSVPVVAFVSHVRQDRAEAARAAGASRVLARSAFLKELSQLVAQAAAESPAEVP
jgi:CheY-like chemotaxis protein